jgi:hypothetical protein
MSIGILDRRQIEEVKDCVREELKIASTLFVFGAYGIGKEKMYMAVAEEFDMKVANPHRFPFLPPFARCTWMTVAGRRC